MKTTTFNFKMFVFQCNLFIALAVIADVKGSPRWPSVYIYLTCVYDIILIYSIVLLLLLQQGYKCECFIDSCMCFEVTE